MICPFRVHTKTVSRWKGPEFEKDDGRDEEEITRTFEPCHGEDCPYYYADENDVPKCARCVGQEEEIL